MAFALDHLRPHGDHERVGRQVEELAPARPATSRTIFFGIHGAVHRLRLGRRYALAEQHPTNPVRHGDNAIVELVLEAHDRLAFRVVDAAREHARHFRQPAGDAAEHFGAPPAVQVQHGRPLGAQHGAQATDETEIDVSAHRQRPNLPDLRGCLRDGTALRTDENIANTARREAA